MATSTWSFWPALFRPLVIGIGAGLIVALLLYVLSVSCGWFCQKLKFMTAMAGGLDVAMIRGGNDACAQGTVHPGGLPPNGGVPNGGVEGLPVHAAHAPARADLEMGASKDFAEENHVHISCPTIGEYADQPLVSANAPNEEMEAGNAVQEDLLHPFPGGVILGRCMEL